MRDSAPERKPALLLDVMGTLVSDPFFDVIPAFFGLTLEAYLDAKHPTAWIEFERGALSPAEFYVKMFKDGRAVDGAALEARLRASYRFLDGMEALLGALRASGVRMIALSNYPVWYRIIDDALGLSRYLDWTGVSCETGVRKPLPAAYLGAAAAIGREPGACLLVDDREANCDGARAVGMPSVLFEDAAALRRELTARALFL